MAEIGLYEAMRTTRAVRRLRPDPVPDAVLRRVIEAATWAPTGGNRQPWRVIVVFCFNPELLAITDLSLGRPSVVGGGSVYPAVQNLLLACRAEGLGCVLTTLLCLAEAEIRPMIELPEPW